MNPLKFDVQLSEKGHLDPDKHYIGEALPEPSFVSDLDGISRVGESSIPAREDHTHGGELGGGLTLEEVEELLTNYYTSLEVDALLADYVTLAYLEANYYDKDEIDAMLAIIVAGIDPYPRAVFSWPGLVNYDSAVSGIWTFPVGDQFNQAWVSLTSGTDEITFDIYVNGGLVDTVVAGPTGGVGPFLNQYYPITVPFNAEDEIQVRMFNLINYTARNLTIILEK